MLSTPYVHLLDSSVGEALELDVELAQRWSVKRSGRRALLHQDRQAAQHRDVKAEQQDPHQGRVREKHECGSDVAEDREDRDPERPPPAREDAGGGQQLQERDDQDQPAQGRASPTSHPAVVMKISEPAITEIA